MSSPTKKAKHSTSTSEKREGLVFYFSWLLVLSFAAVGIRNFEVGLKIDGLLYAGIARTIAQTGEWFHLSAQTPDFKSFTEHPHLGFWIEALIFKILPAQDWAARIQGQLFYLATISLIFFWMKRLYDLKTAVASTLLFWSFDTLAPFYADVYLDPGFVFFGFFSLYALERAKQSSKSIWMLLCGGSLALALLQKGLACTGFILALLWQIYTYFKGNALSRQKKRNFAWGCSLFLLLIFVYAYALSKSSVPDFLAQYWSRQISHRFAKRGSLNGLWNSVFWLKLLKDTHYLILALPFLAMFYRPLRNKQTAPAWLTLLGFVFIYAPNERIGDQYWLSLGPGLSWLLGISFSSLIRNPQKWMLNSRTLAIAGILILQYIPVTLNKKGQPPEVASIKKYAKENHVEYLLLDQKTSAENFVDAASYAWYTGLQIEKTDSALASGASSTLFLTKHIFAENTVPAKHGPWCLIEKFQHSQLWAPCSQRPR